MKNEPRVTEQWEKTGKAVPAAFGPLCTRGSLNEEFLGSNPLLRTECH